MEQGIAAARFACGSLPLMRQVHAGACKRQACPLAAAARAPCRCDTLCRNRAAPTCAAGTRSTSRRSMLHTRSGRARFSTAWMSTKRPRRRTRVRGPG